MVFAHDLWIVFRRSIAPTLRSRLSLLIGMSQPLLYLVLFGPMMKKALASAGTAAAHPWQVYVPAVLVQLALFGAGFAGFAIIPDVRLGVVERLRVTPVSRAALLLGRVAANVLTLLVQAGALLAVAVMLGLRAPVGGVLAGLALVALLGAALAALSYALGLAVPREYQFAPLLNTVTLPLLLLSGVLLPMSLAPHWLDALSHVSPVRPIVDAMRVAFAGQLATGTVLTGTLVALALATASVAFGITMFRRRTA